MEPASYISQALWRFVRGDTAPFDFEKWAYAEETLQAYLGYELHLEMISTNFSNKEAVWVLRRALAKHLRGRPGPSCVCIRLRDTDVVDMGEFQAPEPAFEKRPGWSHEDVMRTWDEVATRGAPLWWLWAARCRECGQAWLVGQEERQNDVFCVRRLQPNELQRIHKGCDWPKYFDSYETMLRLGQERGRSVRFIDPMNSSLRVTISELAKARPKISVSEIATLLNLDAALASDLASKAVDEEHVEIIFDVD